MTFEEAIDPFAGDTVVGDESSLMVGHESIDLVVVQLVTTVAIAAANVVKNVSKIAKSYNAFEMIDSNEGYCLWFWYALSEVAPKI